MLDMADTDTIVEDRVNPRRNIEAVKYRRFRPNPEVSVSALRVRLKEPQTRRTTE